MEGASWSVHASGERGPIRWTPDQKPVPLMADLISLYTNFNDLVLDPFMGSGTTGVACFKLARRFIGIERDAKFFDLACERIEKAAAQPDLFAQQPKARRNRWRWRWENDRAPQKAADGRNRPFRTPVADGTAQAPRPERPARKPARGSQGSLF